MERSVKQRLVGASILLVLIVLIVPELLPGPAPPPALDRPDSRLPASAPEPVRHVTVDLAAPKSPVTQAGVEAAAPSAHPSSAQPLSVPPPDPHGEPGSSAPIESVSATTASSAMSTTSEPASPVAPTPTSAATARPTEVPARSAALRTPIAPHAARPTATAAATSATAGRTWAVQLGSFAGRDNAEKLVRQLKARGFAVYVVAGGSGAARRYRVRIGPLADRGTATQAVAKLKSLGHVASLVPPVS